MSKVFLGGTCNGPDYRTELIPKLTIEYFNPVVSDWNEQARLNEEFQKKSSDYRLYVITPYMLGYFSIAEMIDDSNKFPQKTIVCFIKSYQDRWFNDKQWHSILAITDMLRKNGARVYFDMNDVVNFFQNR